jgi:rhamnosyltransferase
MAALARDEAMTPPATVIVRARDRAQTIERTLAALRHQSVAVEVVVVDSGSVDGTREIAARWADVVLDLPAADFSYGRALNRGARAASAPIHFALSAHTVPPSDDWVERSLAHYTDERVAGTSGTPLDPAGLPLRHVVLQDLEHARRHPEWGFSNTASSWRANVWRQLPFNERMEACEDKEWSWRAMAAGYVIVVDPALAVSGEHRRRAGLRALFDRCRREARELALYTDVPPFGARAAVGTWWSDLPHVTAWPRWMHRGDPRRVAEIAGRYAGRRDAVRSGARRP